MRRSVWTGLIVAIVAALSAVGASAEVVKSGGAAPKWEGKTVAGKTMSLAGLKGKVVLLNFFNKYCGPCREEYPHLQALHKKYGPRGFTVISISNDETAAEAGAFAKETKATFPVLHDPKNKIFDAYKAEAVPTNVVIDRKGKIAWSKDTGVDFKAMEAAIVKALK
jgi:peroxiredoxin